MREYEIARSIPMEIRENMTDNNVDLRHVLQSLRDLTQTDI
jgi:hypothetical protein